MRGNKWDHASADVSHSQPSDGLDTLDLTNAVTLDITRQQR